MPTLFTTGYEQHSSPESLIDALCEAGIKRLLDVRELPISRRRGFSKTALASALADAGIAYEHVRALGNPKPYRDLYRSGRISEGARCYRAYLRCGSNSALLALARSVRETRTCLLCFEASHQVCHRDVIVAELEGRLGVLDVVHLR